MELRNIVIVKVCCIYLKTPFYHNYVMVEKSSSFDFLRQKGVLTLDD